MGDWTIPMLFGMPDLTAERSPTSLNAVDETPSETIGELSRIINALKLGDCQWDCSLKSPKHLPVLTAVAIAQS
jgi:hypothetical protein